MIQKQDQNPPIEGKIKCREDTLKTLNYKAHELKSQ